MFLDFLEKFENFDNEYLLKYIQKFCNFLEIQYNLAESYYQFLVKLKHTQEEIDNALNIITLTKKIFT